MSDPVLEGSGGILSGMPLSENQDTISGFTSLKDLEYQMLTQALVKASGNISKAAKILGVGRDTVYRRLKKYHIGLRR